MTLYRGKATWSLFDCLNVGDTKRTTRIDSIRISTILIGKKSVLFREKSLILEPSILSKSGQRLLCVITTLDGTRVISTFPVELNLFVDSSNRLMLFFFYKHRKLYLKLVSFIVTRCVPDNAVFSYVHACVHR